MSHGQTPTPPLQKPPGYRDPTTPVKPLPPRKATLPPSFQLQNKRNTCCRNFCCAISIVAAVSLLFVLSALGFSVLWFEPRLPEIHLKSIDFKRFNVTTTPDGLTLDAQSVVSVEVKNPNSNLRIQYDRTSIYVNAAAGGTNLGQVTVPGFMQDNNNVTTLRLTTSAEKEILGSKTAQELSNGFKSTNMVMNVEIESGIGIKSSGWATGTVEVKVLCGGVSLSQVQEGVGAAPATCRIKILDWYVC
ncbi:hypothetical protein F511_28697 [Dorcoceras hygrometricum]|uniref:Late embryogenesis abundant protein LEA-2 subgroup domain-containing protein n=1 Tax=Dorcoceras hygrometricum TaxID=472368 RepID=A0A2Z7B0K4_9LAMI|nr:hypothetical protein F511_28697 [Dorcoceras hygrometricum]